jgi:hypothetical protein
MTSLRLISAIMPTHAAVLAMAESLHVSAHGPAPILAKYIIIQRDGREFPILFPKDLQHSEMVPAHAGTPVSAGFFQFVSPDVVLATGESITLRLSARDQDADIIKRHILSIA